MAFNLMAGALSATILKSRGVPNDKVVAGAAVSALTPGILGFVIPLVMARQFGGTAPSPGGGSGKPGNTVDLTEVPDLTGDLSDDAKKQVKDAGLRVTVKHAKIIQPAPTPAPAPAERVLAQEPPAGTFREVGSEVKIYVGEPTAATTEQGGAAKPFTAEQVGETRPPSAEPAGRRKPPSTD